MDAACLLSQNAEPAWRGQDRMDMTDLCKKESSQILDQKIRLQNLEVE